MSKTFSALHHQLNQLSEPVRDLVSKSTYKPPQSTNVSIKSLLESLLPPPLSPSPSLEISEHDLRARIRDFSLCCALLSSSSSSSSGHTAWIPEQLASAAESAFRGLAEAVYADSEWEVSKRVCEFEAEWSGIVVDVEKKRLVIELLPEVLPLIKDTIKESSIDSSIDGDEVSAASARVPVAYAIVAAHQLRWFVTQVDQPHLGKLCALIIPCALTALDHWSPEVKGQGMLSFIHLGQNVNAAELGGYVDVILDACCNNIVSSDEIWHLAVEMSVLFVTSTQKNNPRSPWFAKLLDEMLGHLERQPRDKERCIAWLNFIEPLLYGVGLVLLAHFKRLFPLFFLWIHDDDDEIVVLALKRIHTIVKVTWIRNSPFILRLVDELVLTYKELAKRKGQEEIRMHLWQILILLQQCKALQFEAAWEKYKDDPVLGALDQSICRQDGSTTVA
ncbi:hypothetical protein Dimus_022773 [Dionaea muscipula]